MMTKKEVDALTRVKTRINVGVVGVVICAIVSKHQMEGYGEGR